MAEKFLCPRRVEDGTMPGGPFRVPKHDTWRKDRDRRGARCCTYCGSINPDQFMEYARNGTADFGPTDKSYKVYVQDPNITYVPTTSTWENGKRTSVVKHERAVAQLKFYFQHLTVEQRIEFVALYNARPKRQYGGKDGDPWAGISEYTELPHPTGTGMQIGYPGYFYTLPFFMGATERFA